MVLIIQQTLLFAIPLLIVALAGVFAERSGIINLGLEGGMIFGAFIASVVVKALLGTGAFASNSQLLFVIGMLVSMVAGIVISLLLSCFLASFQTKRVCHERTD